MSDGFGAVPPGKGARGGDATGSPRARWGRWRRWGRSWVLGRAGWWLAASLALHALMVLLVARPDMVDLRVYYTASPRVLTGHLYDVRLRVDGPAPALPFTYPPFAALVFLPLSLLPWPVAAALWQLLCVAAIPALVWGAVRLLPPWAGTVDRRQLMLWVAGSLWLEPVRHTLDLGQVNLFLVVLVLGGLTAPWGTAARGLGSGAGVGVAAGVKLSPAVGGLYFLVTRQWRAAACAALVFAGSVAAAWWVVAEESVRYWHRLLPDTTRIGRVDSMRNQSVRGALSRFVGHDVGHGLAWSLAAVMALVLAGYALRAAWRTRDRLAVLVAVQLLGLLLAPISWSHHWIWCVPALVWLVHGPRRDRLCSRIACGLWVVMAGGRVVPQLTRVQDRLPDPAAHPALLAWGGWTYALCATLTLIAVAGTGSSRTATSTVRPSPDRADA
ncbi:glycosyltransferase 87 family protein [Streptomyces palmae]|uniref:glycosyltransferase 87 family protein n=1 Tax=Streptomyces palmae TaxID=1701085 RepID=UPI0014330E83|nr:glycosyltransferase 87 family protein [Streptomyces palmae]